MYTIIRKKDGTFECQCKIQDGTEYWIKKTEVSAIRSMIQAARTLNGTYIRSDDITIIDEQEVITNMSSNIAPTEVEMEVLYKIRIGELILVNYQDPRLAYRITPEECEMIVKIREGELRVKKSKDKAKKDKAKKVKVDNFNKM